MAHPRCYNCGNPIECDTPGKFCGIPCRDEARRKQKRAEFEKRTRESVGLPPEQKRETMSTTQGFAALADEAAQFNAFFGRMRPGAASRPDLTSSRGASADFEYRARPRQDLTPRYYQRGM